MRHSRVNAWASSYQLVGRLGSCRARPLHPMSRIRIALDRRSLLMLIACAHSLFIPQLVKNHDHFAPAPLRPSLLVLTVACVAPSGRRQSLATVSIVTRLRHQGLQHHIPVAGSLMARSCPAECSRIPCPYFAPIPRRIDGDAPAAGLQLDVSSELQGFPRGEWLRALYRPHVGGRLPEHYVEMIAARHARRRPMASARRTSNVSLPSPKT